jgi:hypothetical protein
LHKLQDLYGFGAKEDDYDKFGYKLELLQLKKKECQKTKDAP